MSKSIEALQIQTPELVRPQESEGVSLPEQWQFDHGIKAVTTPKVTHKISHRGVIETQNIFMEDGSMYRVHESKPLPSKLKFPQTSLKTTAFLTKDNEGFNRHHQIKELEAGLSTVLVSREYKWEGKLSQARTAHNMLQIGRYILDQNDDLDPANIQVRGISRGGMIALGAAALTQNSEKYGLNTFYFSSTAPCYPRPLKADYHYLKMPLFEVTSLLYHVGKMPLTALTHYPRTLDTNSKFTLLDAMALINGDAGKFTQYMDRERTHGYILGYPDDVMGMGKIWQKDFAEFKGVTVDLDTEKLSHLFNGHLRVLSPHDMTDSLKRQLRLAKEHKVHACNLDAIDYNYVSTGK